MSTISREAAWLIDKSELSKESQVATKKEEESHYTDQSHFWDDGSRFDFKLGIKEIAAKIRSYCKTQYPDYKFTVRSDSLRIIVTILSGPQEIRKEQGLDKKHWETCGITKFYKDWLSDEAYKMLSDITKYAKSFNQSGTDYLQEHYDGNFYFHLNIGAWYQQFTVTSKIQNSEITESGTLQKTALELLKDFNDLYARAVRQHYPTLSMYEVLMGKYDALNKQRVAEGLEILELPNLERSYHELKSCSLSTSESLAFIERCLKTSQVERQPIQSKTNSLPEKGRTNRD